jgi:SAM-dependent methyltransferase
MDAFDPRLYALLHTGNPGDLAFYRRQCQGAGSILELGCGDGRVLATLERTGARLTGIDLHPGMCALASARVPSAEILLADMRHFDLQRRFDRVVLAYNSLYCVANDAEVVQVLRRVRAHLAEGGKVLFDGYVVDMEPADLTDDSSPEWLADLELDGQRIEVHEQDQHWPATRDCAVTYLHHRPDHTTHSYTLRHHYLTAALLPELLAQADLRLVHLYSDFRGRSNPDAERLVVVAEAASEGGSPN